MPLPAKSKRPLPIIRLFVSSTFSDQQHERNALHANVWPMLERYCQQRGFTFQAIDLRWGVPAEAGLHHRTMSICFEELKRSQQSSPEPNFLILLGNRYGWRPLPEVITVDEYSDLLEATNDQVERDILSTWYRLDSNAIPPVLLLRSRKDSPDGRDYTHTKDAQGNLLLRDDGGCLDTDDWLNVQETLWKIVNRAFPPTELAGRFETSKSTVSESMPSIVRFQASATEQEIWQGALQVANAKEHVIACFRTIIGADAVPPSELRKKFVDLKAEGSDDGDATSVLGQLKEQLEARLDSAKVIRTECQWATDELGNCMGDLTTDHITKLCDDVYTLFQQIVIRQINEYWGCDLSADDATVAQVRGTTQELELERAEHQRFAQERAPMNTFVGRESEIASIQKYLTETTNKPLIVYGPSGSGKTALLGKVIQGVTHHDPIGPGISAQPLVLSRFIGSTPESSNLRSLLSSLCRELRQEFPTSERFPADINQLVDEFYAQLGRGTASRPIYVFLDGLDQIDAADNARLVYWIRRELAPSDSPCHARLVTTCMSPSPDSTEDGFSEDSLPCEPYRNLKLYGMLSGEPLGVLNETQAYMLFHKWLHAANHKLSPDQEQLIRTALQAETGRSPLYLKVLSEVARRWRSFDKAPMFPESLPNTLPKLLDAVLHGLDQQSEHGPLARIALSLLVSARYGLSEGELLEILFRDDEFSGILRNVNKQYGHELPSNSSRIPTAPWARLRSDLSPYLSERSAPGTEVLHFYHRQVENAVRNRYLPSTDLQKHCERELATYFTDRWNEPNTHALMELPQLLLQCGDRESLMRLLTDLPFPMHKTRAGYVNSLVHDVMQLREQVTSSQRDALDPWYTFVRSNAPFLQDHPQCFFQQAYNEPRNSPVSLAAQDLWINQSPSSQEPQPYISSLSERYRHTIPHLNRC